MNEKFQYRTRPPSAVLRIWVYLGVKTCELFLCFVAIVRVRSIMLTSLYSLFYVTVSVTGFYTEDEPKISSSLLANECW